MSTQNKNILVSNVMLNTTCFPTVAENTIVKVALEQAPGPSQLTHDEDKNEKTHSELGLIHQFTSLTLAPGGTLSFHSLCFHLGFKFK